MNLGIWGHVNACFAVNLNKDSRCPQIWHSKSGTSSAVVKKLYNNMPYGVVPICFKDLYSIKKIVKRR